MDAGGSRQSDYSAVELSGAHLYAVVMVRILLMFALVAAVSLKHFERAPRLYHRNHGQLLGTPSACRDLGGRLLKLLIVLTITTLPATCGSHISRIAKL